MQDSSKILQHRKIGRTDRSKNRNRERGREGHVNHGDAIKLTARILSKGPVLLGIPCATVYS
jgi:hypothetical protein